MVCRRVTSIPCDVWWNASLTCLTCCFYLLPFCLAVPVKGILSIGRQGIVLIVPSLNHPINHTSSSLPAWAACQCERCWMKAMHWSGWNNIDLFTSESVFLYILCYFFPMNTRIIEHLTSQIKWEKVIIVTFLFCLIIVNHSYSTLLLIDWWIGRYW